jgi:hypothetical protein
MAMLRRGFSRPSGMIRAAIGLVAGVVVLIPGAMAVTSAPAAGVPDRTSTVATAVPANLQPPAGNVAYRRYHAVGTQNYICLLRSPADPFSYRWTFQGPQATLFSVFLPTVHVPAGQHFLSPITPPDSGGLPTWQDNLGGTVWGSKVAASVDPAFVSPTAIPWLLLKSVFFKFGTPAPGIVSAASYIQRINTVGGLAPGQLTNTQDPQPETTSCATATDVGKISFEPYEADYVFFRSTN